MKKNLSKWGSIENLGEYGWWGNWRIFGSLRSWIKHEGNLEEVGNVGEEWGSVLGYGEGVRDVGKKWLEMWKSLWGECGSCGEEGEIGLGCEEVWKIGGDHTFFYTFPTPSTLT